MNRSKLAAVAAVLSLTLAACATEGSGDTTDTTSATEDATPTSGEVTGTITDAQENEDGSVDLTVETEDGTQELTTSRAPYLTAPTEAGALQRTRLTTWLQNNDFDGDTEYTLQVRDGVVTDVRA